MTQTLQTALAVAGYQVLLAGYEHRTDAELGLIMALQQRGADALVLVGAEHLPLMWSALRDWDKHALLTWVCDARLPSLGIDNEAAVYAAAQHLLDLGHKRIGMIAGITLHNDRARLRINGVRLALAQAGLKLLPALLTEQAFKFEGGSAGLRALMASRWPPTAIFCGNDLLAAGALLEAARMGLKVPQQLSSCGFDDKALAGERITQQALLPVERVVRGSPAPPHHRLAKKALLRAGRSA